MARIKTGSTRVYSGDPEEIRDPLDFLRRSRKCGVRVCPDGARPASGPEPSPRSGSPLTSTSSLTSRLERLCRIIFKVR